MKPLSNNWGYVGIKKFHQHNSVTPIVDSFKTEVAI